MVAAGGNIGHTRLDYFAIHTFDAGALPASTDMLCQGAGEYGGHMLGNKNRDMQQLAFKA